MPVSLSIKSVPDALVERLRRRAEGNHRSLQRELLAIVEAAVQTPTRATRAVHDASAPLPAPLIAAESEAAWHVVPHSADDGLLEELDRIVAGSGWAQAPLLTRDQLHDRSLAREIDFDARQAERGVTPQRSGMDVS